MQFKKTNDKQYIILEGKDKISVINGFGDYIDVISYNGELIVNSNKISNLNVQDKENVDSIYNEVDIQNQFYKYCSCCHKNVLVTEESEGFITCRSVIKGEYDYIVRKYEATIGHCPRCGSQIEIKIGNILSEETSNFITQNDAQLSPSINQLKENLDFIDINKIKMKDNEEIYILNENNQFVKIKNQQELLAFGNFTIRTIDKNVNVSKNIEEDYDIKEMCYMQKEYCQYCGMYVIPYVDGLYPMTRKKTIIGEYDTSTIQYESISCSCPYCKSDLGSIPKSIRKVKELYVRN